MSAKRKVRSETSSDSSNSPEEKRSREAQNESILSETDDEVLEALEMAEDVGKKIDLILAKLSKLDNIESRLENVFEVIANIEESVANLDREVKELKRKSKKVDKKVEELETSVTFNGDDIADLKRDVKAAQLENENLKKQMLYQEHYSRRENLLFVGIGEENPQLSRDDDQVGSRQEAENTKEVLFNFMEQELQIPNARDKFEFQRVHRLGKPKANESRPIIARFLRYQDREEVLNQARKSLRDKDYSVFDDMPKELYDLRKPQVDKLKEAKKGGLTAYFSKRYPDKLYVNGKFIHPKESLPY